MNINQANVANQQWNQIAPKTVKFEKRTYTFNAKHTLFDSSKGTLRFKYIARKARTHFMAPVIIVEVSLDEVWDSYGFQIEAYDSEVEKTHQSELTGVYVEQMEDFQLHVDGLEKVA